MNRHRLEAQLGPVLKDWRRFLFWRGLARVWFAFALIGLVLVLIHREFGWTGSWSYPLWLSTAALTVGAAIVQSRRLRLDYVWVARQIERDNPKLRTLLLAAVEQQPDRETGQFHFLQERLLQEAVAHHQNHFWGQKTVERLFFAQAAHAFCVALFIGVFLAFPKSLPARSESSLARRISVTPGDAIVERGSRMVVFARFEEDLPPSAELVLNWTDGKTERLPLSRSLQDPVFGGSVAEIHADLNYQVQYGDQQTRPYKVSVFDYPKLERADASLRYPDYTALPPQTIEDTQRITAVEGAEVDLELRLNKPVKSARFRGKAGDGPVLTASADHPNRYNAHVTLAQSGEYDLELIDSDNRTNKTPARFVIEVLRNEPPGLKFLFPGRDQRVSALQEMLFQGEAVDDFGLIQYGLAYSLAGADPTFLPLGKSAKAGEKQLFHHRLFLEQMNAAPDQLLWYSLWAEDIGPDGKTRRSMGDMFFAEVRDFEELFRQGPPGPSGQSSESQGNQTSQLLQLQKEIISGTWNLQRKNLKGSSFSDQAKILLESQQHVLQQAEGLLEEAESSQVREALSSAIQQMGQAIDRLEEAVSDQKPAALPSALAAEQAAYQSLLKLQSREHLVTQQNQRGGGAGSQQGRQQELDQLEFKPGEDRYENQRQASPQQNAQQREQLQILNRLRELAQRQQDLNQKLKELQAALDQAKTEEERRALERLLKRLRDEEQELLRDADEAQQRMAQSQQRSRFNQARRELEQTREQMRRASEKLEESQVSDALAAGTRAERQLNQLRDKFRNEASSQFTDQMRELRSEARELAQKQEEIVKRIGQESQPKQRTLAGPSGNQENARRLGEQTASLTNLLGDLRSVTEQSETSEPLLSKQLYDTLRQTEQSGLKNQLAAAEQYMQRGFSPQAKELANQADKQIQKLKENVERAAESVLGNELETLKFAKKELDSLTEQLEREARRAQGQEQSEQPGQSQERQPGQQPGQPPGQLQNERQGSQAGAGRDASTNGLASAQTGPSNSNRNRSNPNQDSPADQQPNQASAQERAGQQSSAGQGGERQNQPGSADAPAQTAENSGNQSEPRSSNTAQNRNRSGGLMDLMQQRRNSRAPGGPGGEEAPLTGEDYGDWSDRLRDVEELLDRPDLRSELARTRDRARAMRSEFKRHSKPPEWDLVQSEILTPLHQIRTRLEEEIARHVTPGSLAPIDRDPVPQRYSDLVKRYYEKLGGAE